MEILKFIYYGLGILFAYYHHKSFLVLPSLNTGIGILKKIELEIKNNHHSPSLQDFPEIIDFLNILIRRTIISLLFVVWMYMGLFSSNWIYFIIVFVINLIVISPIIRLFKNNEKIKLIAQRFTTVLFWLLCMFLPFNTFFLKIDSNTFIGIIKKIIWTL